MAPAFTNVSMIPLFNASRRTSLDAGMISVLALYLFSLQDLGRHLQILQTAVGAGADEYLIDLLSLQLGYRPDIVHPEGHGHHGLKIGYIVFKFLIVGFGI